MNEKEKNAGKRTEQLQDMKCYLMEDL